MCLCAPGQLEFGSLGFCGGKKTGEPGLENPQSRDENQQQLNPNVALQLRKSNPGKMVGGKCYHHSGVLSLFPNTYCTSNLTFNNDLGHIPLGLIKTYINLFEKEMT